jgi:predicted MFS family arabinose efflux permease
VAGAASATSLSCLSPLVAGAVTGDGRAKANSLMGVAKSTSLVAGPALAALLIFSVGTGWVFVLDAAAFAVSAVMLGLARIERVPGRRTSMASDLVRGWREVWARDWYWTSLIAHAVWNFAANLLLTLGPLVAVQQLGGEGVWIAVVQAGGIGLLIGSLVSGKARPKRPVLVGNLVLATYALPLTLFAVSAPVPAIVAAYAVALTALGFLNPTWQTAVQTRIPASALGRVSSYDLLLSVAAQPLGVVVAPIAAAAWGVHAPFAVTAVLVLVVCVGTVAVPGVRRLTVDYGNLTSAPEPDPVAEAVEKSASPA